MFLNGIYKYFGHLLYFTNQPLGNLSFFRSSRLEIYLFHADCDESCCLILNRTIASILNRDDHLNILETFSYSPFNLLCIQQFHAPIVNMNSWS